MNLPLTQENVEPARPAMKFIYATGSRPVAGYTIKRGLGRGGFGEVYYAVSDAGKDVALKLIRRNLDIELRGVGHCLNLKHPHLLTLFDIKQDDEANTWVVMEYIAGESLEDRLARTPRGLPPEEACSWIRGAAAGLAYLHNHGIVHRDLKPGNIFADEGIVKLGDYGLSKFISCSRRSGQTDSVGTVHYMAPEVANGRYGKQIDIYALGVLLHETLSGRPPFEGESVGEVLMKHLTALPDLSALGEPYRAVVARALAKDPNARFASVEEMVDGLPAFPGSRLATVLSADAAIGRPGAAGASAAGASAAASSATAANATASPPPWNASEKQRAGPASDGREPIARELHNVWRDAQAWWRSPRVGSMAKVLIVLGGVSLLWRDASTFFPWASILLVFYGLYRAARAIVRAFQPATEAFNPPSPAEPAAGTPDSRGAQASAPRMANVAPAAFADRAGSRRGKALPGLLTQPPRKRLAALLGSLLFAAAVTAVISMLLLLMRGVAPRPEQFAWLWIVATLGTWSIQVPAKLWEGARGDSSLRRFALLVIGLAVGAASWGLDRALLVELPSDAAFAARGGIGSRLRLDFNAADGTPLAWAFVVYFGALFLALRWWRQADPLRSRRVSLGGTALAALAAWIINMVCPFPQPWGLMAAAAISLALQLASPWQESRRGLR